MLSGRALRAWGPWFIALLAMVIGIALIVTTPPERVPVGFRAEDVFSYLLLPISSATVGAVVAWRRPHNAVGWLLATAGWISSWQYLTAGYAVHGLFGEVRAFADQLRDEVDLDALRDDLLGAVRQTMAPAHTSLWLRKPSR